MNCERTKYIDNVSGLEVTRLTAYKGHSHHLYFTNPGWHDAGRRLLFGSDRENKTNLFSIDLESGVIDQLTDFDSAERSFLSACVNPKKEEAYLKNDDILYKVELDSGKISHLYNIGPAWHLHMTNCDASGEFLYFGIFHDPDRSARYGVSRGLVSFEDVWRRHPLSRIMRISTNGGEAEIIFEEKEWIGHVNTSPTQPELLTFCHEGPWDLVGQRIWVLNTVSGQVAPVKDESESIVIGHEYWFADGKRLGFHGTDADGKQVFGNIACDNTDLRYFSMPEKTNTGHIFSHDENMIVGDGDGVIKIWEKSNGCYPEARVLCEHNSGMRIQKTHPHPRISPSNDYIVFTSDRFGYGDVFIVPLVDSDKLPVYTPK